MDDDAAAAPSGGSERRSSRDADRGESSPPGAAASGGGVTTHERSEAAPRRGGRVGEVAHRPGGAGGQPSAGVGSRPRGTDGQRSDGQRSDAQRGGAGSARSARTDRPRGLDRPRIVEPELPDEVTGHELDRDVRHDLSTLSRDNAEAVARHLVMAGLLLQDDPERAHEHALAAQRRAGRVGVVREAAGLTAYAAGRHDEALRELRAARRLTGSPVHLPVMADCERGLGRPERAIALAESPEAAQLDAEGLAELRIVVSGARLDMGQPDAAVVALQGPDLAPRRPAPWHARTFTAYADALRAAGRGEEALLWDRRALAVDPRGASGARPPAPPDGSGAEVTVYDVTEPTDDSDGTGRPGVTRPTGAP